jgi:hypothetical protein
VAALQRGDPLLATASPARRWLLIEEPGGWGTDGLTTSRIDADVARTLAAKAANSGVRVQLIRRPGRRRNRFAGRQVAMVHTDRGAERSWWSTVHSDAELLDIAFDGAGGTPSVEPIYLVCTHGRKDVCCAMFGRPIAEHLAAHRPDATWETSHVGGDRFAANLVLLPHGLYYGRMSTDTALAAVKAYEGGLVVPHQLRGRSGHPPHVQAAECYARVELSASGLDALAPSGVEELEPNLWQVRLADGPDTVTVTVRAVMSPLPAQLTCATRHAAHYRTFDLVELHIDHAQPSSWSAS